MATEITLEKIELVKDRTGVSYKESKDALEAADGNVVDAIIAIEETINISGASKAKEKAQNIVDSVKEYVKKGNISKIVVKRDDEVVLNLPVNATLVGGIIAPWGFLVGVIATFVTKSRIELVKDDGSVINVSEKATDKFGDVATNVTSKGADIAESLKEKGGDALDQVKNKVQDVYNQATNKTNVKPEDFKDTVDEMWEAAKKRVEQTEDVVADAAANVASPFETATNDSTEE